MRMYLAANIISLPRATDHTSARNPFQVTKSRRLRGCAAAAPSIDSVHSTKVIFSYDEPATIDAWCSHIKRGRRTSVELMQLLGNIGYFELQSFVVD